MKILLYEHASGGGYAGQPVEPGILAEGFAMMRTVASDFQAAGHEVTVLIDARISRLNPPLNVECTVPILYPEEPKQFLKSLASINDASYIIAPETGQTLQNYIALMVQTGKISLNSKANTIEQVADKANLMDILLKNSIDVPKGIILNVNDNLAKIRQEIKEKLCYPIVLKPVDGVSCSGLSILDDDANLSQAISKIIADSPNKKIIVQEYVQGEAVSVSLLVSDNKAIAISLNKQKINVASPDIESSYLGGCVPFDHPMKQEAFELAKKAIFCFSELRGYVGVDLVLGKDKPFIIDVNPRLTTSYVALSQLGTLNIAQALIDINLNSQLPPEPVYNMFACFEKVSLTKPSLTAFQKSCELGFVISPAFPMPDSKTAISLIAVSGQSARQAAQQLEDAKKTLLDIFI